MTTIAERRFKMRFVVGFLTVAATALINIGVRYAGEPLVQDGRHSHHDDEARRLAVRNALHAVESAGCVCYEPEPVDPAAITSFSVEGCTLKADAIERIGRLTWLKELSFYECYFEPDTLNGFRELKQLEDVAFWGTNATEMQLTFLKGLTHLRNFKSISDPQSTKFSDECLQQIPMKELIELDIAGSLITDDGLAPLSSAKYLKLLNLSGTNVKGPGLRHLVDLPNLEYLNLAFTGINDQGLRQISALKSLKQLILNCEDLTDASIVQLEPMIRLEQLNLAWCQITDAAIPSLIKLKGLQELVLVDYVHIHGGSEDDWSETKLSKEGVARLQAALPGCKITSQREQ